MRGQHDRMTVAVQGADESPECLPQFDIDAGSGLVEHDHGRLMNEGLSHRYASILRTGYARMLVSALDVRSRWAISSSIQLSLSRIP